MLELMLKEFLKVRRAIAKQGKAIANLQTTGMTIKEYVDKMQSVNANLLAAAIFQQVQALHHKNNHIVKNYKHKAKALASFVELFPQLIAKVRALNVEQIQVLGAYYGRQFYKV
ncbi:hypothetical protein GGF31_007468 [Allomyces arbusculus]|nr:hypothetical protein GGF31_007468 [Allomyces arbusculus]